MALAHDVHWSDPTIIFAATIITLNLPFRALTLPFRALTFIALITLTPPLFTLTPPELL